ncbi:N-acetylneuraminate synthase [Aurantiacibacter sp. D1-12]|uniref:N-acetylneuraminate synthase n=1 Tax=Aurantiacibacter sp. D1-12 TaxID=2993658 RepID=UPI00237C7604|nr:N-acetylneuraminate synthase [Aurantiacibacter sp. D1-12]MDE1466898.1 N-acetylneuraminate synthase [Aurantiacibacter sp. D1-12]
MTDNLQITELVRPDRCFIIAEIGVNHNGSMDLAKEMIDAAHGCGVDAVKFQLYRTDELVTKGAEKANYQKETTGSEQSDQRSMLKALELNESQHAELFEYCTSRGITYMCTPYDIESAKFLVGLGVAAIKVASSDTTNLPFLRQLDALGTGVILSTGMCTMDEVRQAVEQFPNTRANNALYVLQCTSQYPAPEELANLRVMDTFRNAFDLLVGYSDHTVSNDTSVWAVARGASIIEKHFTTDRNLPGPDHRASADTAQFEDLVRQVRAVETALGSPEKTINEAEAQNKQAMQKSLYFRGAMQAGDVVSEEHVVAKRPAAGMAPAQIDEIVGRKLSQATEADEPVSADLFE